MATLNEDIIVLVVDDDDIDAMAITRALKKLKLNNPIVRARDGVEALSYLTGNGDKEKLDRPHVVLLDINMPRMNGHEFLEQVRTNPELNDTVIFILTTSSDIKDRTMAYRNRAAGYIVKSSLGASYQRLGEMLSSYWQVVTLPA